MTDASDDPIVKLVQLLFASAVTKRAVSFFVEPSATSLQVWFLVDGVLRFELSPPLALHAAIVDRVRSMAGIVGERGEVAEGELRVAISGGRVEEFFVHLLPTPFGDKLVVDCLGTVRDLFVV